MKKSIKISLGPIIIVLIAIIVIEAYFIIKNKSNYTSEINGLKDQIKQNETLKNINNTTNMLENQKNNEQENQYIQNDFEISGIKLGMSKQDVINKIGNEFISENIFEEATGYEVTIMKYQSLGLTIELVAKEVSKEYVRAIILDNNTDINITKGLKISSTADEVLNSFESDWILCKQSEGNNYGISDNIIVIGYPGDDVLYNTNNKGKLYFSINADTQKVDRIQLLLGNEI